MLKIIQWGCALILMTILLLVEGITGVLAGILFGDWKKRLQSFQNSGSLDSLKPNMD